MKIENIKIITHKEIIQNADIEIVDGIIQTISRKDGEGTKILIPGFIDTHIHGFGGFDAMDGIEAIKEIVKAVSKNGTTSYFPTVMTATWSKIISSLESIVELKKELGSIIAGIHLEGPFISFEKKGAHDENHIILPTVELIEELGNASKGLMRKITIAPELLSKEIADALLKHNITPTIGHGNANAIETRESIANGAAACTHLWNAMSGVANRNPGMVEVILQSDAVYAELITDLIHVDAEAIGLSIKSKGVEKIVVVTDAIRPAGLPDGFYTSGGLPVEKKGNLITLKDTNTIAGSGATMHDNFKNLVELGYDIKDVVRMTSYNAAISMELEKTGSIEVGHYADILILNKELKIEKVYIHGKEVK